MRSKTDFYRLFFEQLARRGFDVKRSQSSDYIADIYFKNQLVAYFSKVDTVIQNPFVTVKDKLIRLINDTAQDTANKAGICRDCPCTDANEKLFTEEELRVLHAGLVKMSILDQDVSNEARESVERILDKIEDIIPELREQEMEFDFDMEFGQQEEMEIGG